MNTYSENPTNAPCHEISGSLVVKVIQPKSRDLGEFSVRRVLPASGKRMVGPWLFFDHMGPVTFAAGKGVNVRPHPHIHLATVTYLFEGEMLHRDSLGNEQVIIPGDINLMVAGRGIVHSERERPEVREREHSLHALQLWLALPEELQQVPPAFYHYPSAHIPSVEVDGVPVRVMMGSAYGHTSPVKTFADTLYIEAHLQAYQRLHLPETQERGLYIASGSVQVAGQTIQQHEMGILTPGSDVEVVAHAPSRIALVGGEKMTTRYLEWNFASTDKAFIEQAKADWRAGKFPKVPGDEEEFIPLPE
ncbi:pirin family protein [Pseudobowmanella zhangzhouensis]|uniref:pirin family protein n=1 Tax=Pseudobowmanella zhangzhouensis TaxID=1537679 RepID=UPI003607E466